MHTRVCAAINAQRNQNKGGGDQEKKQKNIFTLNCTAAIKAVNDGEMALLASLCMKSIGASSALN
jgi:hypothetical protein